MRSVHDLICRKFRHSAHAAGVIAIALIVSGCGGGGGSSRLEQPVAAPIVAGVSAETTTVWVRSSSEVVLNGENSDGTRFPIDTAEWRQTDSTGFQVQLDKRTDKTVAFRVPEVDGPITLSFELDITNLDGEQATAEVIINVLPGGDIDRFLEYFRALPNQFVAVPVLAPGVRTTSEVSFRVTQRQLVTYEMRMGGTSPVTPIAGALERTSSWLTDTESDWTTQLEAANEYYNPNLCFSIPRLDIDSVNILFDDVEDPSGLDDHQRDSVVHWVELELEVLGGACEAPDPANPGGFIAVDCSEVAQLIVLDAAFQIAETEGESTLIRRALVDELKASTDSRRQPESAATAQAYYDAIDPNGDRLSLRDWLQQTGFRDANGDLSADSLNTLYINNYDLGFTRDMHVRTAEDGSVYAYVTNYAALRPAILRKDPDRSIGDDDVIATVAMEYSPPDGNPAGEKFTKFLVYVPDGSGDQRRVNSLNFDGRGEKWIPGACTPCHGGIAEPLQAGVYPNGGDIDAAFLPWDPDSFLFVDSNNPEEIDPIVTRGFEINPDYLEANDLVQFSRETQHDLFRAMNEAALSTMNNAVDPDRFDVVRDLVHGWYGSDADSEDTLPETTFDGGYIPPGWTAENNPGVAGVEEFYTEVFGRHCRICHNQAKDIRQFETWTAFASAAPLIERFVFEDGTMPNARVDADRLWVDFHGDDPSAAERLAAILNDNTAFTIDDSPPGMPIARIQGSAIQTAMPRDFLACLEQYRPGAGCQGIDSSTEIDGVQNLGSVRLDASLSSFIHEYEWTLTGPDGLPRDIVGATTAKPAFAVDTAGNYIATLVASKHLTTGETATSEASVTIIADPNAPMRVTVSALSLAETTPDDVSVEALTAANLEFTDLDSTPAQLTYTVATAPANGCLVNSVTPPAFTEEPADCSGLSPIGSFTQQAVNDGEIWFVHLGDDMDSFFVVTLQDQTNTIPDDGMDIEIDIQISVRNDRPVERPFAGTVSVRQGDTVVIDDNVLEWDDEDNDVTQVDYIIEDLPDYGILMCGAAVLSSIGDTCTQFEITNGDFSYTHDDSENLSDSFAYSVTDNSTPFMSYTPVNGPLTIDIIDNPDAPSLAVNDLAVSAGLEVTLSGTLNMLPGASTLEVSDPDTAATSLLFTVVAPLPSEGTVEVGGAASLAFSLQQVIDGDVTYQHNDVTATDGDDDTIMVSLSDGTTTLDARAVTVDVSARTDGPSQTTLTPIELDGYVDSAVARNGSERTLTADPPWNSVPVLVGDLLFDDAGASGAGECAIRYRIETAPTRGTLQKRTSTIPLTYVDLSASAVFSSPGTPLLSSTTEFTQVDINMGRIRYLNDQINGADDSFVVVASDCVLEAESDSITVDRHINASNDVGWVIDTRWSDSSVICDVPDDSVACRKCHAGAANTNVCGNDAGASNAWTTTNSNDGTIQLCNLSLHFSSSLLPTLPSTSSHTGGLVLSNPSTAIDMLQAWEDEGFPGVPVPCP